MLKIGDFSRLSQVTVKTLHHYADLGLFNPAWIDPNTGYRHYTVEQLPRIHRILALKEIGLSLDQIGRMLDEDLPTEQIRGMLRLKQSEIEQTLQEEKKRLSMVEFRLRMIEAETNFPDLDVLIKSLPPMRFLAFFVGPHPSKEHGIQTTKTVTDTLNRAFSDGLIRHNGTVIDIFHGETIMPFESPELTDRQHEILVGIEAGQKEITLDGIGALRLRDEPGYEAAATLVLAKDGSNLEGWEKVVLLRRWAIAHGYAPSNYVRFEHRRGPLQTLNRDEFVIEVQLPLLPDSDKSLT